VSKNLIFSIHFIKVYFQEINNLNINSKKINICDFFLFLYFLFRLLFFVRIINFVVKFVILLSSLHLYLFIVIINKEKKVFLKKEM